MIAIAGAILVNASCILMVHESSSNNLYPHRLLLMVVGAGLIGWDLALRWKEVYRNVRAQPQK